MTRLEVPKRKFWEVSIAGAKLQVRFGKLGTAGQLSVKQCASPAAAKAEAQKLVASKLKKGYVATSGKPIKRGPQPLIVVHDSIGDLGAMWIDDKDVWFVQLFEGDGADTAVKKGTSLADALAIDDNGGVERWHFESRAEAERATRWVMKHASKRATVKGDMAADFTRWSASVRKLVPRTPRYDAGRGGSITATRDRTHPWIHPRPPSTSWVSNRLLVPVFSLVGPLDPRLGKDTGFYVCVDPLGTGDPYSEPVYEVYVQDRARRSTVDAYFEPPGAFWSVHLSLQIDTISDYARWAVTEHNGDKGTVGFYRTKHLATKKEAIQLYDARLADLASRYRRVQRPGAHYSKVLEEIDRHARVKQQRPLTTKLARVHGAMAQGVVGYTAASENLLSYKIAHIGGAPHFCQEEWDFTPKNHFGKGALLPIVSVQDGDEPLWSAVLNDGDAGTINFWAAPGEPLGTASFSCH